MARYWNGDGDLAVRRCNTRGPPYFVSSHDRHLPPVQSDGIRSSTGSYSASQETFHSDHESEHDSKGSRRRIPVACGRCRKRKIRCSGPQGDNRDCSNCKNAGSGECQFNRVQSEVVPFRDATIDYGYNTDMARLVHCRSYKPQNSNYSGLLPSNSPQLYRPQQLPDYQYQLKPDYYANPFNADYSEDGLEYNLSASGSSYPSFVSERSALPSSYTSHGPTRAWTATQAVKPPVNGIYFDSDPSAFGQSQSQLQYSNPTYNLRSNGIADTNNFSLICMASSLPPTSAVQGNERVLPMPPSGRTNNGIVSPQRSMDGLSYSAISLKAVNANSIPVTGQIGGFPSTSGSFHPLTSSPDSADTYNSTDLTTNLGHQQEALYGTGDTWTPAPLARESSVRAQDVPLADSFFGASIPTEGSRRASQSAITDTPANNHLFQVPYHPDPLPQLSSRETLELSRGASHRRSNGSLHAA